MHNGGDEMNKINKTFSSEIKQIGQEEDRTLRFITSTESEDRDGDIIEVDGWKLDNYMKNPVILYGHDYGGLPIGKSVNIQKDSINKKLIQDIKFPTKDEYEFADTVYRLAKSGYLNATSVGFIGLQSVPRLNEKGEYLGKIYKKQELLETSIVPVPSNPTALMEARSKGIINDNELKMLTEEKKITTKPGWDETETSFRFRVRDPDLFQEGSFRTVPIKKDKPRVNSIMGRLKGEKTLTVQSIIFPKEDDWDLHSAKSWLKEHEDLTKGVDEVEEKTILETDINEEISKSDDPSETKQPLKNEIKVGATISAKTKEALEGCINDLQKGIEKLNNIICVNSEEEKVKLSTSIKLEMSEEMKQAFKKLQSEIDLLSKKNNEDEIDLDSIEFIKDEKNVEQDELDIKPDELKTLIKEAIQNEINLKEDL